MKYTKSRNKSVHLKLIGKLFLNFRFLQCSSCVTTLLCAYSLLRMSRFSFHLFSFLVDNWYLISWSTSCISNICDCDLLTNFLNTTSISHILAGLEYYSGGCWNHWVFSQNYCHPTNFNTWSTVMLSKVKSASKRAKTTFYLFSCDLILLCIETLGLP